MSLTSMATVVNARYLIEWIFCFLTCVQHFEIVAFEFLFAICTPLWPYWHRVNKLEYVAVKKKIYYIQNETSRAKSRAKFARSGMCVQ